MAASERKLKIRNKLGLHARAAVKFVQLASKYKSEIKVAKDDQEANGKSIMGLLTLVAAFGMEIVVKATGPDAEEAVAGIAALVDRGFDEGVADA
jgi:phosphocarrier protein HPr